MAKIQKQSRNNPIYYLTAVCVMIHKSWFYDKEKCRYIFHNDTSV